MTRKMSHSQRCHPVTGVSVLATARNWIAYIGPIYIFWIVLGSHYTGIPQLLQLWKLS